MVTREEAYKIVMGNIPEPAVETVSFREAAGRIIAEDVISDIDMPPFNRAAVDGYACRRADAENELEVVEVIRAGMVPMKKVGKNQCAKIMTGAIVPDGCDFVFMVEYSRVLPSGKVILTEPPFKANFSAKGEDVKAGDVVLRRGKIIKPQDVAVLASVGCTEVRVAGKPQVAIISTGDELVEPEIRPGIASIRNSNAYQLLAQAERTGAKARYYGIAPDDEEATLNLINTAMGENNIVVLTGGVSMGDYDFVPSVLTKAGVRILFDQVNVQPGKPTTFGVHQNCVVFGLPGNPVSAFIQFETLVRPFIYKSMGHDWKPVELRLPMARKFERKAAGRAAWVPVVITETNEAMPSEYHGSAHITAFPYSDGIVPVDAGKSVIEKGEIVSVRQI